VAARYVARERIFTGLGPNLDQAVPVFSADDLTLDECQTLVLSVQKSFNDMHQVQVAESWFFELGPSVEDDAAAFINLKSQWANTKDEIEGYRGSSSNSWKADVFMFYSVASEHAEVLRGLRGAETPVVYLQCDSGRGYETFDCVDCLTWDELETLEAVLGAELYDMGFCLRIVSEVHAERDPALYVQAKRSWHRFDQAMKDDEADETRIAAGNASYECIEEIKALRSKPVFFGPDSEEEGVAADDVKPLRLDGEDPIVFEPMRPNDSLRSGYRDPDNYWRNVWLYQQRQADRTNSAILAELRTRAAEFEQIDSENALRSAIDAIAIYHRWPLLKGKAGRPRAKVADNDVRPGLR